jgi:hypothetical protein
MVGDASRLFLPDLTFCPVTRQSARLASERTYISGPRLAARAHSLVRTGTNNLAIEIEIEKEEGILLDHFLCLWHLRITNIQ